MKFSTDITSTLKGVIAGLVIIAGISIASAQSYAGPTAAPTGGNATAPLNVGATAQTKNGGLSVNAFSALQNAYFAQKVGMGTQTNSASLKLDVEGQVGATEYCDSNGANCSTALEIDTVINNSTTNNTISVPSGAVMSFDLSACPTGWSAYTAANGRNIIGVGDSSTPGSGSHPLGDTGGRERHTLTIEQIPSHRHGMTNIRNNGVGGGDWERYDPDDSGYSQGNTLYAGGGEDHPVMDPYIALRYCKKD